MQAGLNLVLDWELTVGGIEEVLEVTADTPMLERMRAPLSELAREVAGPPAEPDRVSRAGRTPGLKAGPTCSSSLPTPGLKAGPT